MDSKELTKNTKKLVEDTNLSWEKEDQLVNKYLRESRLLNPQKNQKQSHEKTEDTDLSWERQDALLARCNKELKIIAQRKKK